MTNLFRLFRHPEDLRDLTPDELQEKLISNPVVIDVRTTREFEAGHIAGAVSIPLGQESSAITRWPADADVVLICKTGHRSQAAAATLLRQGFRQVSHLKGGMDAWRRASKPVV
ncbi:rhodanese-like domain-containing protein [Sulfobacillus harzensis]|uniref:Rhodanese-like domain-containing protein n=1 Tax=Sulfobacillus harzensis TaxID=2729629 RepID=A0A7Y0L8J2_9FIRM|nr:rhodanese-like domain-containing protein [Sulfobacillus harzensis]NMP24450.1 rhodanese-like domain-containing protein [Sulfobacillus harzensis]